MLSKSIWICYSDPFSSFRKPSFNRLLQTIFNSWFNVQITHGYIMHTNNYSTFTVTRDKRCFLENEATAVDLFVREDLLVGDTVGVLGVLGDPSSLGDIQLSLQEDDSPVTLLPYSKNLTLIRKLDKEGIEGPASVYINVICARKHTLDPVR